jgi:hypothetical protein
MDSPEESNCKEVKCPDEEKARDKEKRQIQGKRQNLRDKK